MAQKADTPVRRQYLNIKRQYSDTILFFRLGDFYETFDDDAETVARVLDIVLTSRSVGKGQRVPMAGIPHHAVENYLGRLIAKGYHVAICDQTSTEPVDGLMPRGVVRVITPGTIVEPGLLPGDANNYLACVIADEKRAGVAYVDITTGEFAATELGGTKVGIHELLRSEINRLNPAEILLPENINIKNGLPGYSTQWPSWRFEFTRCEQALLTQFKVSTLEGFGVRGLPLAVRAAGAVIQYLAEMRPDALNLLAGLKTYHLDEFMTLDAATRRNLELTETLRGDVSEGSLLAVLDHTMTSMGKRLMHRWVSKPLLDVEKICQRQDGIEYFYDDGLSRIEIRAAFKPLSDLERLTNRVVGSSAHPRDLVAIRDTLQLLPGLLDFFKNSNSPLDNILSKFDLCEDVLTLLEHAITDEPPAVLGTPGVIRAGFSQDLDEIISASQHARDWIKNLEPRERTRTGISTLKVGYNKVFGYYIEVTQANSQLVPDEYIRKQTLVRAERYITPELKEYESLVLNAEERIKEIERRVFREVCDRLAITANRLLNTARAIAQLDVLSTLAEVAAHHGYVRPEVLSENILEIEGSRHPVVERMLLTGRRFIPNDVIFEDGEYVRIITGPNMSGKSTFLRQVALIVLMAQMGSFVPADRARIGLVDRIFTRIGAQDEIHAGQSTFMVEMVETATILNHATSRSLLILDEIGRGTSTYDGVSIAWAIVEYLHNHPKLRSKTLFATHYHELTQLSDLLPGVRNYNVAVSEADGEVVFLYKIIAGGADRSYGIHVAQLAGLPYTVIQRAGQILRQLEASSGRAVETNVHMPQQLNLFPETNPLLDELRELDINELSPIEAINRLYAWQNKFLGDDK